MKKSIFNIMSFALFASSFLISCTSTKNASLSATKKDTFSKEDMPFEFGTDVSARFTGTAYFNNIIQKDSTYNFPVTNVITFAPSSRSSWHVHGGMEILVVGGKGIYQEEGKKAQIIRKGDVVHIPAGVQHWHGATSDSWFQQIVIYDADWKNPNPDAKTFGVVTDEWYKNLDSENYAGRKVTDADTFIFGNGTLFVSDKFSGKVYLSEALPFPNEAGAPGLHNVVFEKGCYNNWHSHAGGQILIVTDGIGYHQVEGGKVEVLHAGDVAFCPPNVMHWHGATADSSFAHLAANTNPEKEGVVWGERLSEEEYKNILKE